VGKTSIIQGLAQRIADEDCPSGMKGLQIFIVQNSVLMSGAVGGELTRRISGLLYELQNKNAVLFIEDLGVILEKGGYELQEVLKSSLSSGCLRVVASCAVSDQTKLKDGGLGTRFQVVEIKEPSPSEAARMLRVHAAKLEAYHGVRISDAAIIDSAKLSDRYMSAKKLPEKAIGLLDQAACLLKIIMQTKPGRIESLERKKTLLLADYEAAKGTDKDKIAESLRQHTAELEELNARWALEQETVERYRKVEEELQKANAALTEVTAQADLSQMAVLQNGVIPPIKARLKELNEELQKIQKDGPLVRDEVTSADIAHVLAKETGIPVDQMMGEELERLQNMEKIIAERIIGQKKAVEAIAAAIRCSRAGLQSETKPVGSFLFPGPTGVGKTEIAKAFAEFLFGSEKSMIRFDMSEFKEPHSVALMLGSPPGYQGSDQGGKLTEAIRQQPYSVLLFDEVEKAHPDIFNILLALLDDGRLTDARGITVDCRNVIVIMTTNIGSKIIQEAEDLVDVLSEDRHREPP
jgi:ATP-dependent Clp protease ATP-binding subunit ClpB